jgi:hypothetical protein
VYHQPGCFYTDGVKLNNFFFIALRIKIPEIIAKIFAINNCERASYFFGLCEYSVNKNLSIEEKNG